MTRDWLEEGFARCCYGAIGRLVIEQGLEGRLLII